MLQIPIDPRKMGGYVLYFVDNPMINLCHVYVVQLRGYYAWAKYIITLIRFKYIPSDFHPEAGYYFCGEKCLHLCYFIQMFNEKGNIFVLGEHGDLTKGKNVMRIQYFPVCK